MKRLIVLFLSLCSVLLTVACGGGEATTPATEPPATEAAQPALTELTEEEAAAFTAALDPDAPADTAGAGCEEYFCVTSTLSGAVETVAAGGMGANVENCAAWAAPGAARVLDLPMMLAAGEAQVTVALTRIAAYTGPGDYELQAVVTSGIPDMFPAIEAAGRTFNNGDASTAVVTINADGSGTLEARDLVEIASFQVSNPVPNARVDFTMQWTCQEIG